MFFEKNNRIHGEFVRLAANSMVHYYRLFTYSSVVILVTSIICMVLFPVYRVMAALYSFYAVYIFVCTVRKSYKEEKYKWWLRHPSTFCDENPEEEEETFRVNLRRTVWELLWTIEFGSLIVTIVAFLYSPKFDCDTADIFCLVCLCLFVIIMFFTEFRQRRKKQQQMMKRKKLLQELGS